MNNRIALALLLSCAAHTATAQISSEQKQALDEIKNFARELCTSVGAKGTASEWKTSVEGKAQVAGMVQRIADLGFKGAAEVSNKKWEGVLQADLASVLTIDAQCRLKVFEKLESKLLRTSSAAAPAAAATQQPACNFLAQDQVCMGMQRSAFKALPLASGATWGSEGSRLVTSINYRSRGLSGKAWFYFTGERLSAAVFESTAASWSRVLNKNIFFNSNLKPKWQPEDESSGGSFAHVENYCASIHNFRQQFNDQFGPPTRQPADERNSIEGLMKKSDDYCKGDRCNVSEATETIQRTQYKVSPSVVAEVSSIFRRAEWERYIGFDNKRDDRTRYECILAFRFESA